MKSTPKEKTNQKANEFAEASVPREHALLEAARVTAFGHWIDSELRDLENRFAEFATPTTTLVHLVSERS